MLRSWPLFVLVPCVLLIGTALVAPKRLHTIAMASESDGVHQDDHRILGLIPYSTQREDPNLRVTRDAFAALAKAGIPDVPESHRAPTYAPVFRMFYPGRTEYCIQFDLAGKSPKDVADLYARALPRPSRHSASTMESVEGLCRDGKTHLDFIAFKGAATPVQLRLWTSP